MNNPLALTEPHRPELHLTAERGALYAPAAVLIDGTTWHVFHQYRLSSDAPYTATSPARWGHQASAGDCFNWEECNDVLAPTGSELLVRAGAVVPQSCQYDGAYLYFTSVTPAGTHIELAFIPSLEESIADTSDDPLTLEPSVQRLGPVVTNEQGVNFGLRDFRSPCVVRGWADDKARNAGHEGFLMLAVTGDTETPGLAILASADGHSWQVQGPLEFVGNSGIGENIHQVVSPRIARLRDEVDGQIYDVLIVTLEEKGIDISGYLVGTLQGTKFVVSKPFERLDYGHDFTRPRGSADTSGPSYEGTVIMGLLNGVGRLDNPANHLSMREEGWANVLSLPRMVTLQGGRIYQTPMPKLVAEIANTQNARSYTAVVDIPPGGEFVVELFDASANIAARLVHTGTHIHLDRSMNLHHQGSPVATAPVQGPGSGSGNSHSLTVIVDGSTVELFADGGAVAMASRVYFDGGCQKLVPTTKNGAKVENSFHRLARSLNTPLPVWDEEL
ncbi:GH32 C-terminal domain-containing protein [Corynebacterium caspium]|uniref:GH32 C-terminal domain-containing protein n=1 Tax=Corynebacterium caspium TaxID=234828 RepID=UPI0003697E0A|nr:GH32 C-terminal domain-containing protein [Corynebacterium caspium]WKD59506.1 Sucrose-6-phosphate hydrolase [Corynebacterium caspium DSM 44850]